MKTRQEMEMRSLYMPKTYWNKVDKIAHALDLSSNQLIRHIISDKLLKKSEAKKIKTRAQDRSMVYKQLTTYIEGQKSTRKYLPLAVFFSQVI